MRAHGAGALEVDLEWERRAAAGALDASALSLAAGPRWFLAALAPRVPQPRRGLSLQARTSLTLPISHVRDLLPSNLRLGM